MEEVKIADSRALEVVAREPDPKLSDNALRVLQKRYLKKDDKGRVIETPKELFARVAWNLAQAERNYGADEVQIEETARRFFRMISNLEFLPNSPTLMNAGLELQQLSACFVLPVDDSLVGIFESLKHQALIHQCLAGETLIMTDGGLVPIRDAVDAFFVDTDSGALPVSRHWVHGREPVFEVRTNHGHSIRATAEHRFLFVADHGGLEWRRLSQLRAGDWLVLSAGRWLGKEIGLKSFRPVPRRAGPGEFERKPIRLPDKLTEELAELVGLYMGDGTNSRWGIRFIGDREEIDRVRYLARECFGVDPTVCRHRSIWEAAILRLDLKEWWEAQGFRKKSSLEAFVPDAILKGPESCAQAFVRGLFAADGCARTSGHVTLATSSANLARQIPVVLFHLGIPCRVLALSRKEGGYQISVCSKQGFETFRRDIGFGLRSKDERLSAVALHQIFVRGERVPNQKEPLQNWYAGLGSEARRLAKLTLRGAMWMRRYELSRHHIGVLHAQGLQLTRAIEDRAAENYLYTRVTKVVPSGEADVFDLTVELKHSYIASGFVTHNSGGGTGFSFSRLRPKGDFVKSTMGVASGPVSFMKIFDAATQTVKQGGRRRGANMGILRVDHPDILDFITCKDKTTEITNFNISVAVTDKFLEAAKAGTKYDLINPRNKQVVGQLDAREVLDKIAYQAWKNGEPGLFFIDENSRRQPTPNVGEMEATNPCGEEPLLPYESCNLGSIDLQRHLKRNERNQWEVDWQKLESTIRTAVRALDNVIDMSAYPIKEIEEMTDATRKIGLGVMGFARLLFALEVPYDSKEGVEWGRKIMKFIQEIGYNESAKLAEERGVYPAWEGSRQWEKGVKVRNSYVTTVAPTGTISMIADTSGGCEPEFSLIWYKRVMDGEELPYFLDYFEEVAKREGFWREDLVQKILDNHGSPRGLKEVPRKWQRVFATAHDISPEWHVRMQAAFQDHSDAAVSKCITGDSWIFTERGLLRIGSLHDGEAPDSFSDRNLRIASNPGVVLAKEYYYGGVQPVVRVSTDLGLQLGGTPVHQVKVVEDGSIAWRRMVSLKPGDRLLVEYGYGLFGKEHEFAKVYGRPFRYSRRTNSKKVRIPYKITVDLARLLGYLVADGGWNVNQMYLTSADDDVLEDFRAIAARRFGARVGATPDRRTAATRTAYASSREIVSFLRDYLGMSNRAETKSIPEMVLRSGREIQKEFLRGLTLDGYVRQDGRLVPLTTTSVELARQAQMMLLNLGIPAAVTSKRIQYAYRDDANRKDHSYELAVLPDWRREYLERIGFAEQRKQRVAREKLKVPGDTVHGIPVRVADLEALASAKLRIAHSRKFKEQLWSLPKRVRAGQELSRDTLLWFLDVTADLAQDAAWKRLSELVHRPFLCARVERMTHGREEVHDFHVPSNNTFVANGFVSHNTINLPREATVDEVKKAYLLAYDLHCKGITVYRDGSREDQVLNIGVAEAEQPKEVRVEVPTEPAVLRPRPRPDVITGRTQKILTGYGALYVTVNEDEKGLFEVFAQIGRGGGYTASFTEGIARLASLCLRSGVPVDEIIDQLEGIRSPRIAVDHGERVYSIPDAIAKAIKRHIGMQKTGVQPAVETFDELGGSVETDVELEKESRDAAELLRKGLNPECPECGKTLVFEEGCVKCHACGYSEC